jgi:hypothetical protein
VAPSSRQRATSSSTSSTDSGTCGAVAFVGTMPVGATLMISGSGAKAPPRLANHLDEGRTDARFDQIPLTVEIRASYGAHNGPGATAGTQQRPGGVPMTLGSSPSDAIKARTLNLTLGSGFAAFVAAGVTVFNKSFKAVFGDTLDASQLAHFKVTLLVAIIAAFALIATADILARAWATASANTSTGDHVVLAAPVGLQAKKTEGTDIPGFTVGAIRFLPGKPDDLEYLLVKAGSAPEWVAEGAVALS